MPTLGERNNNPGCIRAGNGYAAYKTLEDGYLALVDLLSRKYNNRTALEIFEVYAPGSDGNNPQMYAEMVIQQLQNAGLNINSNTVLNLNDINVLRALCCAISRVECGKTLNPNSLETALQSYLQGDYIPPAPYYVYNPRLIAQPSRYHSRGGYSPAYSRRRFSGTARTMSVRQTAAAQRRKLSSLNHEPSSTLSAFSNTLRQVLSGKTNSEFFPPFPSSSIRGKNFSHGSKPLAYNPIALARLGLFNHSKYNSALDRLYYVKLLELGKFSDRAPRRQQQASEGKVALNNIPSLKNKYDELEIQAILNLRKTVEKMSAMDYPDKKQEQIALATAVMTLKPFISQNTEQCNKSLAEVAAAAFTEINERKKGRYLNDKERERIHKRAEDMVNELDLDNNKQRAIARSKYLAKLVPSPALRKTLEKAQTKPTLNKTLAKAQTRPAANKTSSNAQNNSRSKQSMLAQAGHKMGTENSNQEKTHDISTLLEHSSKSATS